MNNILNKETLEKKNKTASFRFSERTLKSLDELSLRLDISKSDLINQAIINQKKKIELVDIIIEKSKEKSGILITFPEQSLGSVESLLTLDPLENSSLYSQKCILIKKEDYTEFYSVVLQNSIDFIDPKNLNLKSSRYRKTEATYTSSKKLKVTKKNLYNFILQSNIKIEYLEDYNLNSLETY